MPQREFNDVRPVLVDVRGRCYIRSIKMFGRKASKDFVAIVCDGRLKMLPVLAAAAFAAVVAAHANERKPATLILAFARPGHGEADFALTLQRDHSFFLPPCVTCPWSVDRGTS
jgi:hypothetical protein